MNIKTSSEDIGEHGYSYWTGQPITLHEHNLTKVPQSIADGWQGFCSCGVWSCFVSFYEFDSRDDLLAEIDRLHSEHANRLRI